MVFASRYPGEIAEMAGYGWKGATPGEFDWKVFLENKNKVRSVLRVNLSFLMPDLVEEKNGGWLHHVHLTLYHSFSMSFTHSLVETHRKSLD